MKDKKHKLKIKDQKMFLISGLCFWFLIFNLLSSVTFAQTTQTPEDTSKFLPLVTCGLQVADNPATEENESITKFKPCKICDIWVLADRVVNFIFFLATPILIIVLIAGGFIYVTSGGNPKKTEQAKSLLTSAIFGIIIALAAWVIVSTILKNIAKEGDEFMLPWDKIPICPDPLKPEPVDLSKLSRPEVFITPGNFQTDTEIRSILAKEGIRVNKPDCPSALQQTNCTSLSGLPQRTLNYILELNRRCKGQEILCGNFVITGGTEGEGTIHKTHGVGKPVIDISPDRSNPTTLHYQTLLTLAKAAGANPQKTFCEKPDGTVSLTCTGADHVHVEFPR